MHIISSSLSFAPISWWAQVLQAGNVTVDHAEHFQKMSYRNRYNISGANNPIQLTVPLTNGRGQRTHMTGVLIHNNENWQVQHWRTLTSVYKRSPYWEFYEPSLQQLFTTDYIHLTAFNMAALEWVCKQLKNKIDINVADTYIAYYPTDVTDLRNLKPSTDKLHIKSFPRYYQMFEERTGFLPNLSILDLLFSEGPATVSWINEHRQAILYT